MTKIYQWSGEPSIGEVKNFGDALGSWILDRLGVKHEIATPQNADLFAVGSVLHKIPNTYEGKVIGAGALYNEHYFKPFADVYALRGHLTAHSMTHANKRKVALGDPGLLIPLWVPVPPAKHALGVIPHWSDQELGRKYSYGHVIDVSRPVGEVLNEIALCKRVISSSLHGVIVADAFGIPRRAELPPSAHTNKWEGADFKWHDYSTIFSGWEFETEPHFGEFWTAPRDVVKKHQAEVRQAFADAGLGYKPAAREVAHV